MKKNLILASQSPRRKALLAQLGYQFTCQPANIDESVISGESPAEYVSRIALEKAQHIARSVTENVVVLGADTSVIVDDNILAKPHDLAECITMLSQLSGRTHHVLTAIAIVSGNDSTIVVVKTEVSFKLLSKQEIIAYWHTGEPQDKAGSYGIQGIGGQFVKHIAGSYSAVVGLPLYETATLLTEFGFPSAINQ